MNYSIFVKKSNKTLVVNFADYPVHVQEHIIEYGLKQKFNDCHAAEPQTEEGGKNAWGLVENLQERLLAGELSKARSARSPVDAELDSILSGLAKSKLNLSSKELKDVSRETLLEKLSAFLGKKPETILAFFTKKAEAIVEEKAKAKAKLMEGLGDLVD